MTISYEQARKDHEYLWNIGPADDMTGGYVDQEDLGTLLKKPTKATAKDCYCNQISYWFSNGIETHRRERGGRSYGDLVLEYPELREIEDRHSITNIPW